MNDHEQRELVSEAVRTARADEARWWERRVRILEEQLAHYQHLYTQLLEATAKLKSLDRSPVIVLCARPGCLGHMRPGKAIAQTYTGAPDFPGGEVVTMSPGGPGALMDCMKCDACGWSVIAAAGDGDPAAKGPLGPLPEPDVTALSDYFDAQGQRHSMAYSVDAVRQLLAAERERSERLRQALLKCKTCALPTEVRELVSSTLRA